MNVQCCMGYSIIIYMLFTGLEVHIEIYLPVVSKMVRDCRPRDIFETEGKYISILTDQNSK